MANYWNQYPEEDREIKKLNQNLQDINDLLKKQIIRLSGWRAFLNGILFSLGSTIGFAILIALLAFLLSRFPNLPFIDQILQNLQNYSQRPT
jgi:ABC-type glycerol-3-phosphate transport system permease component